MSNDPDIRELQVEVGHLKHDHDILMQFRDDTARLIYEKAGEANQRNARGARAVRFVTLTGGSLGILGALGVIISELV